MSRTVLIVSLPLLALAAPALAAEQTFMVTGFEGIAAAGPHKVIVTTGKAPSVRAVGARQDLDRLKIEVKDQTLRIGQMKSGSWLSWSGDGEPVTLYVTTRQLRSAKLAGSGDVAIDRMDGRSVKLNISGAGDLNVGVVKADELDIAIAGSGDIAMTGTCDKASISIAGSGNVEATGLKCKSLTGKVAGSGNMIAEVSATADLRVMGSGDITINGTARCTTKTMGSGSVRCGDRS